MVTDWFHRAFKFVSNHPLMLRLSIKWIHTWTILPIFLLSFLLFPTQKYIHFESIFPSLLRRTFGYLHSWQRFWPFDVKMEELKYRTSLVFFNNPLRKHYDLNSRENSIFVERYMFYAFLFCTCPNHNRATLHIRKAPCEGQHPFCAHVPDLRISVCVVFGKIFLTYFFRTKCTFIK